MLRKRYSKYVYLLVLLIVITAPYGLTYLATPTGHTFTGFISLSADDMTYLAKMRQGYDGSWLYKNPYTPAYVDAPGQPIFLVYLLLGHVARWLDVSLVTVFHAARVLLGLLLAVVLVRLLSVILEREYFTAALVLGTFGAGFEWITYFAPDRLFFIPVPEAYVFSSTLFYPHFTAALVSYILIIGVLVFGWPAPGSIGAGAALLVSSLVLTSIHPYMWLVIVVVIAAVHMVERRGIRAAYWVIPWFAPAAVYGAYMLRLFLTSPVLGAWRSQTATTFDVYWLLMLAPLLLAALLGLPQAWKMRPQGPRIITLAAVQGLLLILPLSFSRRLVEGWGLPLGILAGIGLVAAWQKRKALPGVLAVLAGGLLLVTPVFAVTRPVIAPISTQYVSTWVRNDALELFEWMRTELPDDAVIFCNPALGNQVPAYANRTVVMGHWSETMDSKRKADLWRQLVVGEVPVEQILQEYPVTHVVAETAGLRERLEQDLRLQKVYEQGRYSVFSVLLGH